MELRTLMYFVTVAEELNITKAAEILCMSQPPLSFQIKKLEEELNTKLFIRGSRRLKLTESGQLLYRRAKEIINLSEKAETEIKNLNTGITGTISIGLVEGMAPDIASEWIANFMKANPMVRFRILDGSSDELIEKMRSGIISLAVIAAPYDQLLLNSFKVGREEVVAIMSKSHPLASVVRDSISITDLKDEKLIVPSRKSFIESIYRWFRTIKSEPKIVCEMDSYLDAAALARRGAGISIFPRTEYIPNESLVFKNISEVDTSIEHLFVWRKGHPLPAVEESFIDYVKKFV